MTVNEAFAHLIPDRDDDHARFVTALAGLLQDVLWEVKAEPFDSDPEVKTFLTKGFNLFVEHVPRIIYDLDGNKVDNPQWVIVAVFPETVGGLATRLETTEHKFETGARIQVQCGRTDVAEKEATLLYKFLLQRQVGFTSCGLQVRQIRVVDEPGLVGVDDSGLATYQFRVIAKVVREY